MIVVTKDESRVLLSSSKKDKKLGLDSSLFDVFIGLFDIISFDLLRVVKESISTGTI